MAALLYGAGADKVGVPIRLLDAVRYDDAPGEYKSCHGWSTNSIELTVASRPAHRLLAPQCSLQLLSSLSPSPRPPTASKSARSRQKATPACQSSSARRPTTARRSSAPLCSTPTGVGCTPRAVAPTATPATPGTRRCAPTPTLVRGTAPSMVLTTLVRTLIVPNHE